MNIPSFDQYLEMFLITHPDLPDDIDPENYKDSYDVFVNELKLCIVMDITDLIGI
jgi:hypothetical protein